MKHNVVIYFAGWHLDQPGARLDGEVAGLPWDKLTHINHAFWFPEPLEAPKESSFARRESGNGPRKEFRITPLSPYNDLGELRESALVPGQEKRHFSQYAYFAQKHPDVRVMLSIGGWTKSGFFSEMVFTREGRASFIRDCLKWMDLCPWIGGIDIDWEYPAGGSGTERHPDPADPEDQGCPVWGTAAEDLANFTALLRELREAMAEHYGAGAKQLTACCCGSVEGALMHQDWAAAAPYLDLINIMSYDLAGLWGGIADHASSAAQAMQVVHYLRSLGIPAQKLCIGSPLYGSPFQLKEPAEAPLGKPIENFKPIATELLDQPQLMRWEAGEDGWQSFYDSDNGAPYLYNDSKQWFVSYENARSLERKLTDIRENDLGGIIVWEAGQDTRDAAMISQMYDTLNKTE